jgi:hypothetical protein
MNTDNDWINNLWANLDVVSADIALQEGFSGKRIRVLFKAETADCGPQFNNYYFRRLWHRQLIVESVNPKAKQLFFIPFESIILWETYEIPE